MPSVAPADSRVDCPDSEAVTSKEQIFGLLIEGAKSSLTAGLSDHGSGADLDSGSRGVRRQAVRFDAKSYFCEERIRVIAMIAAAPTVSPVGFMRQSS